VRTESPPFPAHPVFSRTVTASARSDWVRYAGGVLMLTAAYYGAAKLGQTLRYTASVSAIWPPAGLGIGALLTVEVPTETEGASDGG
jgi:hypothetical protein